MMGNTELQFFIWHLSAMWHWQLSSACVLEWKKKKVRIEHERIVISGCVSAKTEKILHNWENVEVHRSIETSAEWTANPFAIIEHRWHNQNPSCSLYADVSSYGCESGWLFYNYSTRYTAANHQGVCAAAASAKHLLLRDLMRNLPFPSLVVATRFEHIDGCRTEETIGEQKAAHQSQSCGRFGQFVRCKEILEVHQEINSNCAVIYSDMRVIKTIF